MLCYFILFCFVSFYFILEKEGTRAQAGEGQRERERQKENPKQALCPAQSPVQAQSHDHEIMT